MPYGVWMVNVVLCVNSNQSNIGTITTLTVGGVDKLQVFTPLSNSSPATVTICYPITISAVSNFQIFIRKNVPWFKCGKLTLKLLKYVRPNRKY